MTHRFLAILAAAAMSASFSVAQQKHPDLSGIWAYSVDQPPNGVKQTVDGKAIVNLPDLSGRRPASEEVRGSLPFTPRPNYKPAFAAKVKELDANQSRADGVFYCGRPGVPRLGPPRKIVQMPTETIFLYEDMSGDTWRIVPTNTRERDPDLDPSFNGDAIGWWEGDKLVVESVNFVENTWFGELGYMHSDQMKVTEYLWLQEGNLAYQVKVEDPEVLAEPWVLAPRLIKPSDSRLLESPVCVDYDGPRLQNSDHHGQR
jgi:hypothetical protein